MLVDSHCHLNYDYSPKTADDLVSEAKLAGVEALVTIGTDLPSLDAVRKISEKHPEVYHTAGVHPHETGSEESALSQENSDVLMKAAAHPKCRAIGEIGLDYHYDHSPREIQRRRLEQQLEIALATRQPIVVHSREGEEDLLSSLSAYAKRATGNPGVIHCFTGTEAFGRACLDLGFYISFSGIITFKKAEEVRGCAAAFPLERLLVETDSPYLAPIPHRGKKCEPSMVKLTAMKLAEIKGLDLAEVARVTTANARALFRMALGT